MKKMKTYKLSVISENKSSTAYARAPFSRQRKLLDKKCSLNCALDNLITNSFLYKYSCSHYI